MPFHDGFLSEIVGRRAVINEGGVPRVVGRVVDFIVTSPADTFPKIDGITLKTRAGKRLAPIATVIDVDADASVLLSEEPTAPPISGEEALYLVEDLFDKQIVDVNGRKVVRINDVEIAKTGETLRVVAADVGVAGLLRRLGAGRIAPGLVARVPRSLIAWDTVAPLSDVNPSRVELAVAENRLAKLHPSDLAEIISDLSARDAARVVESLDDETAADALEHLDAETQRAIIDDLGAARAADIIEEMDSDDAADLLGELPEAHQAELYAEMDLVTAGELRELVAYEGDTAGGMMTTDYLWIYPHRTVGATIEKIREIGPETEFIYYLYVTDQAEKLLGALSLRTLLLSPADATIHSVMDGDLVTASPETSAENVAGTIARYDLLALPVVDEAGRMLGIVTVDDAIDAILPEKLKRALPRFTKRHKREKQPA